MSNLAAVLRGEITRLARKEIRSESATVRRSSAQHRRDIAALKRQVSDLERKVSLLERQAWKAPGGVDGAGVDVDKARFSAKGLASHRKRLGLTGAEFARLAGVSPQTLYNWEQGRSRPRKSQMVALINLRELTKKEARARLAYS